MLGWMDVNSGAWMTVTFPIVFLLLVLAWGWTQRHRVR